VLIDDLYNSNVAFLYKILCISAIAHNPVMLAIISLSKSFSPKYLLFSS